MRVSAIRVGTDLWRLLEQEASLAGVSVSQYMREAALARASAAATARGEDVFELLARAAAEIALSSSPDDDGQDTMARCGREVRGDASDTRGDARALQAQSKQARKRSRQLQAQRKQLEQVTTGPRQSSAQEAPNPQILPDA